jgi:hypothetical protein
MNCPGLPWLDASNSVAGATPTGSDSSSSSTTQNAIVFALPIVGAYIGWRRKRLLGAAVGAVAGLLVNRVIAP